MANNLQENPWTIDTPGAGVLYNANVNIHHMEFVAYTNATDTVVVQNMNGHNVWDAQGESSLSPITTAGQIGWIHGLKVPTLGSGFLKIFIKP